MGECVLNLASEEYAAPLRKNALPGTRITEVRALAPHRGKYRSIVAWTKQLRGALARYAIRSRAENPSDLIGFAGYGFRYAPERSSPERLVWIKEIFG